ncbi:MAG: hypothetical protein ACMUIG_00445 [Thermoplasmatota archaeon]
MQDEIVRKTRHLNTSTVMEAIKERLIEHRFNIETYERINGKIEARRNNLQMILSGLYRKVKIDIDMNKEKEKVKITLDWYGYFSSATVSFVEFFLLSLLVLQGYGINGLLGSVLIGTFGSFINMILFAILKARIASSIKRDLWDLERSLMPDENEE